MIRTGRLILRSWEERDRAELQAQCVDPRVMQFLGPLMTREQVDAALDRQNALLDSHGYCFWAVERVADGALLGACGLKPGAEGTPIEDDVEIGWRFGHDHWGQGYAREAAQASLDWAWSNLSMDEIAAITTPDNVRSWGLMERLGMRRSTAEDFEHPKAAAALKSHITYRIARPRQPHAS